MPIYDFVIANDGVEDEDIKQYYPCCGKTICRGCVHSFAQSGNNKCPFSNSEFNKTEEDKIAEMMKRVEANDPDSIFMLGNFYYKGLNGVQHDQTKAMELYIWAADLSSSSAHYFLAKHYHEGGALKKAKFHLEASAMAGNEIARHNLGIMEDNSGNIERAVKHWTIGASAGGYTAMHHLRLCFEKGYVSRESIDSTLAAYNRSCAEMRSEARDAAIHMWILTL